jgi:site-specific DNA-methyltransferase (adenine-specific)
MIDLQHGDCIELMKGIADNSVDLVLCDLPYGTTANRWDVVIPFEDMWSAYERIVKPKGNIVLFGAGLFAFKLALSNERLFRYDMVWKKSKCGSPLTAKYMPLKKHEMILVFGESASYYEPQMGEGKPYSRKYTPNNVNNMQYGIKGVQTDNKGTRHPSTVLDFPQMWRRQDQIHPTQKPVELMEFLIRSYCPENGIVLDNCMGSGTTGVACVNTNRSFIGFELVQEYFDIASKRIDEANKKLF